MDDQSVLISGIYDLLMCSIEPELMQSSVGTLEKKYAGESKEDRDARMERYAKAYLKFDEALAKFTGDVRIVARSHELKALKEKEKKNRSSEETAINSLASAFR